MCVLVAVWTQAGCACGQTWACLTLEQLANSVGAPHCQDSRKIMSFKMVWSFLWPRVHVLCAALWQTLWCPHGTALDLPRLLQTCPKLPLRSVSQCALFSPFVIHFIDITLCPLECAITSVSLNTSHAEVYWSSLK